MKLAFFLFLIMTSSAFAIPCDCEVRVFHPLTASHRLASASLIEYQLESFDTLTRANQVKCRNLCEEKFRSDVSASKLYGLLAELSHRLIDEGVLGHNCTGLTTVKYPVRVKANLGRRGLGNVADRLQVVSLERKCF